MTTRLWYEPRWTTSLLPSNNQEEDSEEEEEEEDACEELKFYCTECRDGRSTTILSTPAWNKPEDDAQLLSFLLSQAGKTKSRAKAEYTRFLFEEEIRADKAREAARSATSTRKRAREDRSS